MCAFGALAFLLCNPPSALLCRPFSLSADLLVRPPCNGSQNQYQERCSTAILFLVQYLPIGVCILFLLFSFLLLTIFAKALHTSQGSSCPNSGKGGGAGLAPCTAHRERRKYAATDAAASMEKPACLPRIHTCPTGANLPLCSRIHYPALAKLVSLRTSRRVH